MKIKDRNLAVHMAWYRTELGQCKNKKNKKTPQQQKNQNNNKEAINWMVLAEIEA